MHELELMLKRLRELRIPPLSRMGADRIYRRYGVTEEEFFDLSTEDDKWELLDGTLIIHSPASVRHELPAQFLYRLLADYVEEKDLGHVFADPMVNRLPTGKNVSPDAFFVRKRFLRKVDEDDVCIEAVPALVIEVTSKWRRKYDLREKLPIYKEANVPEIWVVDLEKKTVHHSYRRKEEYIEEQVQEGRLISKAVRGFWIDVGWLWQRPLPKKSWALEQILRK